MNLIYCEIDNVSMERPHLILLGAGASLAAFPHGDRNGRKLPLMNDLVQVVGLENLLLKTNVDYRGRNFEEVYSELQERIEFRPLVEEIESLISDYFSSLKLPDEPTLYDHLVLSLRSKDVIATFNWDPFLFYACARNCHITDPPYVFFLHGNVAIGYCLDDNFSGPAGSQCKKCGKALTTSKLLYPVTNKDYTSNPYIEKEWNGMRDVLRDAYVLTIFGYSAPKTDVEAIKLLKDGWGNPGQRQFERIEIIDIKDEEELVQIWRQFICAGHYQTMNSFYESWAARHPRRTCEAVWDQYMEIKYLDDNRIRRHLGFKELWKWYEPIIETENKRE